MRGRDVVAAAIVLGLGGIVAMGFFSKRSASWSIERGQVPWDDRPSIYGHIRAHVSPGKTGLTAGGQTLPDEARIAREGGLRWAAGALDGAFGHHAGGGEAELAPRVHRALGVVLEDAAPEKLAELYSLLVQGSTIDYVDALSERLVAKQDLDVQRLRALAVWLATRAPDREPVKLAIAMLGISSEAGSHDELLVTLGRHEEFTLFAAVALANAAADPERRLFELAQHVEGWGRIQIVERLAATNDPEIRRWMLRDGFRNSVMNEYLAYTCATAGGLLRELSAAKVDPALLAGAGEIIEALIAGGPAQDMDDYGDGAAVVEAYLRHLEQPSRLEQLLAVDAIRGFLDRDGDWAARERRGWTLDRRQRLRARCAAIVSLPRWKDQVTSALEAGDDVAFGLADRAARVIGIDTWEKHYARLRAGNDGSWYSVMQTRDPERVDRVIALAEERIPLARIATGPADELGMGPQWGPHGNLDFVLQDLHRFPGKGWTLISAGLRSPVVRNRHMALRAFSRWGRPRWPRGAEALLRAARAAEPDERVREAIDEVLAGRALPEPGRAE